jgi:hypothetical protein
MSLSFITENYVITKNDAFTKSNTIRKWIGYISPQTFSPDTIALQTISSKIHFPESLLLENTFSRILGECGTGKCIYGEMVLGEMVRGEM